MFVNWRPGGRGSTATRRGGSPWAAKGAHSVRRVLHAHDATGREISRVLWAHVAALPTVRVVDDARAVHLTLDRGACVGARYVRGAAIVDVRAAATLLATGGAGRVFRETTNPPVATGDGVALAWHAGAAVSDLEFVQFHPTVMAVPGTARFLLSEALRGDGAWLLNGHGERFMTRYEPAGELASRDLVARAIVREEVRTGAPVTLSLRHLDAEWVRRRFPDHRGGVPRARPRPGDRSSPGVAGGALHDGRRGDRHRDPHHRAGSVRGRRGGMHRRPRRQPPGEQLAAGRPGLWRSRGRGHVRAGAQR